MGKSLLLAIEFRNALNTRPYPQNFMIQKIAIKVAALKNKKGES